MKTPTAKLGNRNDYHKAYRVNAKSTIKKLEDKKKKQQSYSNKFYEHEKEMAAKYGVNVVSTLVLQFVLLCRIAVIS